MDREVFTNKYFSRPVNRYLLANMYHFNSTKPFLKFKLFRYWGSRDIHSDEWVCQSMLRFLFYINIFFCYKYYYFARSPWDVNTHVTYRVVSLSCLTCSKAALCASWRATTYSVRMTLRRPSWKMAAAWFRTAEWVS